MVQAKQHDIRKRPVPALPDEQTRLLRAKLIMEEAVETVEALGFQVQVIPGEDEPITFRPHPVHKPDLVEILDGCADIFVVTTGTLVACNVPDKKLLEIVDENNMDKFKPGHSFSESGKLIKPPDHRGPTKQIVKLIDHLTEHFTQE